MRVGSIVLIATSVLFASALVAWTEDVGTGDKKAPEGPPPSEFKMPDKAKMTALAKLHAQCLRLRADLIEAQIADKPDTAKIASLRKELQQLQKKMQAERPMPPGMRGDHGDRRRPRGGGHGMGPGGPGFDDFGFEGGPGGPEMGGPGRDRGPGPGDTPPRDKQDKEDTDKSSK